MLESGGLACTRWQQMLLGEETWIKKDTKLMRMRWIGLIVKAVDPSLDVKWDGE